VSLRVCRASSCFLSCILALLCILVEPRRRSRVHRSSSGDLWVVVFTLKYSVSSRGSNPLQTIVYSAL
jgi:hypothetical protein